MIDNKKVEKLLIKLVKWMRHSPNMSGELYSRVRHDIYKEAVEILQSNETDKAIEDILADAGIEPIEKWNK